VIALTFGAPLNEVDNDILYISSVLAFVFLLTVIAQGSPLTKACSQSRDCELDRKSDMEKELL